MRLCLLRRHRRTSAEFASLSIERSGSSRWCRNRLVSGFESPRTVDSTSLFVSLRVGESIGQPSRNICSRDRGGTAVLEISGLTLAPFSWSRSRFRCRVVSFGWTHQLVSNSPVPWWGRSTHCKSLLRVTSNGAR